MGASPSATGPAPQGAEPATQSQAEPLVPSADATAQAAELCEQFIGQILVAREVAENVLSRASWTRLKHGPVRSINAPVGYGPDGFAFDIDSAGFGWARFTKGPFDKAVEVTYVAGMAETIDGIPEPLKAGIERMAWHIASGAEGEPPAAITALWRPYRIMRLS